jgi:HK97 family phage major capsid protein
MEELIKEVAGKVEAMKSNQVTKEELLQVMADVTALKTQGADVTAVKEAVDELALKLLGLETKGINVDETETLKSVLASKKEELSTLKTNRSGSVQFALKAVGPMTFATNVTGQVPVAERETGITRIQRRSPYLLQLVNVGTIMSNLWEWVEQKLPEGGAGMTGEGLAKSQADFDLVLASATVKKVTAYIKVTKEMLDDIDLLRSEIDQELTEIINLKIDDQILSGAGTGVNLTGIQTNATAWAAGAFALNVVTPNNSDVLRVAMAQIETALFTPNYIVMHPTDIAKLDLDKDTTGQYVFRPLTNSLGLQVSGIPVISNVGIAQDNFLVGDFSKSAVRFKEALTINVGYENDDFTKNFVTILAEARLVHRVKSNHYGAFVKGVFSTSKTALTKP